MSLSFPVNPTLNQVYQGWIWNGAAWDPNYASQFVTSIMGKSGALQQADVVGPGNRVLLSTQSVSSAVALLNVFYNFTNAYDVYEWEVYDLRSDTNSAQFGLRVSTDGSTFDATTSYTYATSYATSQPGGGTGGASGQQYFAIGAQLYLAATQQSECVIRFAMPWATDRMKFFFLNGAFAAVTQLNMIAEAGGYSQNAALRGFQFFCTPGNITRGVFSLYGHVKAGAGGS